MSVLTGVLLDVSGSMERSIGGRVDQKGGSWARSIFKVVDDLIKNDVSKSNSVFTIGVGGSSGTGVFDMLNTLKNSKPSKPSGRSKEEILEQALRILETNGAPRVRTWAKMNVLLDAVSYDNAELILNKLKHDPSFSRTFINDCLPEQCRFFRHSADSYVREGLFGGMRVLNFIGLPAQEFATRDSITEVIEKGMELVKNSVLASIGQAAVMEVQEAHEILHGCVGDAELSDGRVDELMEAVKPFIFGGTPLIKALNHARDFFALSKYQEHHKLLFVLSDGMPADGNNPPSKALSDLGVTTVCCFITDRSISDPLRLYSIADQSWEGPAKFMFRLSSTLQTQLIPRTVFVKRGWRIDTTNNETRLFWQVNHPDIVSDVCDLARNVVCCQDALADVLATVSLDLYINQANQGFGAKEQKGGTCYANASAAVLHLAMKRILGRRGGYPDFFDIRHKLIQKYGEHGASTLQVLREVCPEFRLRCEKVDVLGAMKAVAAKRPAIAIFRLTVPEWKSFSEFFKRNKDGVLTKSEIDISKRPQNAEHTGHAVVLTSYNSGCLRLMNSWGSCWADGGFFRVRSADVLGLEFIDVFWTLDDLKQEEKDAYTRDGPGIGAKLMSSLQGLKTAMYRCPLCSKESKVVDFSGRLLQAKCPQCKGTFNTHDADDDLVMNMYLTSLCH